MLEKNIDELGNDLIYWAIKGQKALEVYAKAKEDFILYDDVRKIRFAQIMTNNACSSEAKTNRLALISKEWIDFTNEFIEAKINLTKAQLERDNADRRWETIRSVLSIKKGELNKLNG